MPRPTSNAFLSTLFLALSLLGGSLSGCTADMMDPDVDPESLTFDSSWGSHEATVEVGQWVHYEPLSVEGGTEVRVTLSDLGEGGDADLFVSFSEDPAEAVCAPELAGGDESCVVQVPEGSDKLFISVLGVAEASSGYRLDVARIDRLTRRIENGVSRLDTWTQHTPVEVRPGSRFEVELVTEGSSEVFVRWDMEPSTFRYDCGPEDMEGATRCSLVVPEGVRRAYVGVRGGEPNGTPYRLVLAYAAP